MHTSQRREMLEMPRRSIVTVRRFPHAATQGFEDCILYAIVNVVGCVLKPNKRSEASDSVGWIERVPACHPLQQPHVSKRFIWPKEELSTYKACLYLQCSSLNRGCL